MAQQARGPRVHERWAHLRFSAIGQLLAAPAAAAPLLRFVRIEAGCESKAVAIAFDSLTLNQSEFRHGAHRHGCSAREMQVTDDASPAQGSRCGKRKRFKRHDRMLLC